jgi:hypothetical protein
MSDLAERLRAYAKNQGGWHNIDDTCEEAAARIKSLEAENLKLSGLLCIIHRDGGHYIDKHGLDKALADAHLIWDELIQCYEENGPRTAIGDKDE